MNSWFPQVLLGVVNVTLTAFFNKKFQSILSLMLFTLTDNPHLYRLEIFLSDILMTDLFGWKSNKIVIFSKTENSYQSKYVRALYD